MARNRKYDDVVQAGETAPETPDPLPEGELVGVVIDGKRIGLDGKPLSPADKVADILQPHPETLSDDKAAVAPAVAPELPEWSCHLTQHSPATKIVRADTEEEAKVAYLKAIGAIRTVHGIVCHRVTSDESACVG